MLRHAETMVVFQEVPDEITLAINITGCPNRCEGCHSPHLWKNEGTLLTNEETDKLVRNNPGITCMAIMGGDADKTSVARTLEYIKKKYNIKTCWYSGEVLPEKWQENNEYKRILANLDFIKTGPYIKEKGPLDSPETNQRFFKVCNDNRTTLTDITYRFH